MRFLCLILLSATATLAGQTAFSSNSVPNYKPITGVERGKWFIQATAGPETLLGAGVVSAGWSTWRKNPVEYPPTWEGFGQRYGMRLTGVSTGNAIEATLGSAWGEDPRYFPSPDRAFKSRVRHIIKATFMAPGRDGRWRPSYARYAGNVGNNFLSNTWRVESEANASDAALRCVWGITGKMTGNAFSEFWPDIRKMILRK